MLEINDAFKDSRTRYLVNDKALTKAVLFNPSPEDLAAELKAGNREVDAAEWDAFRTKSQRR